MSGDLERRMTHLEASLDRLLHILICRADISVNDARAAKGLRGWDFAGSGAVRSEGNQPAEG